MKTSSKMWFEKFYSESFSDVTYTSSSEASDYVQFLKGALHLWHVHLGRPKAKAKWPELSILDQCCGNGSITSATAKELKSEVLGVDLSKRAIKCARKEHNICNCKFKVADAREFCKKDQFDVVTCWHNSCSYSEDDALNLKQFECMSKNLKKNGLVIIDSVNPKFIESHFIDRKAIALADGTLIGVWYKLAGKMLSSKWQVCSRSGKVETFSGMSKLYTGEEYRTMLDAVGVEVVDVFGSLKFDKVSDDLGRMTICGIKR